MGGARLAIAEAADTHAWHSDFFKNVHKFSSAEPRRKDEFAKSDAYERKCQVGPAQQSGPVTRMLPQHHAAEF